MLARTFALFLLPLAAFPAVLPETIGHWQRGEISAPKLADEKVWREYGLQESETAAYADAGKTFTITAYRFADTTGAFAAWIEARPADSKPFEVDGQGVETASGQTIEMGNYVFVFQGYKPDRDELGHVVMTVPKYNHSPLPTLPKYLPAGAVHNSERYILGPESLAKFAAVISPSVAAFHYSSEAEVARYIRKGKETAVVVFSYPSPEMARKQYGQFEALHGLVVKRAGPLLAAVINPVTPDDAEKLLAEIRYQADITMQEAPPSPKDNPGNLMLNIAVLCGVLIGFCLLAGLAFGGIRMLLTRAGVGNEGNEMGQSSPEKSAVSALNSLTWKRFDFPFGCGAQNGVDFNRQSTAFTKPRGSCV